MTDFYEIDFLDVEAKKSGDAIAMRYRVNGVTTIHVTDGGYQETGERLCNHIRTFYGWPKRIDFVVVTHQDGDHTGGLRTVLESFEVGELWMLRPWLYADQLIHRFSRYSSVENLRRRLKEVYSNLAALEEIALARRIPIKEPFQGARIGQFTVLAPSRRRFLDLIVESERTPEAKGYERTTMSSIFEGFKTTAAALVRSFWGQEIFPAEGTSAENEMSVVQYATLNNDRILLTGDAGREALTEAANFAPLVGLILPGITRFQVPHHGSRHNVSTEVLDRWLGPRRTSRLTEGLESFTAIISSAKEDPDHPRKSVIRAMIHRGAMVITTEGKTIRVSSAGAPPRPGWVPVPATSYPEEQEE
ncbi:ComEC/Rec2 family competence protein [Symbiobacterium terraclitae]|uniref:ComEC/Rec2 family competence protein n=1 Tax=Symbiobacterium terraclitae TaxID=557451 RepID=UPI0035B56F45